MREFTKCLELLAFELKRFSLIENEQQKRAEQESKQNANAAEIAWCGKVRWVQWRKEQLERDWEQHRNRCTAYTEAMRLVDLLANLATEIPRHAIASDTEGAAALPDRFRDVEHCLSQVRLELRKRPDGAYGSRPWHSGPLPEIDQRLPCELRRLAKAFGPPSASQATMPMGGRPKKAPDFELLKEFEQGTFEGRWKTQADFARYKDNTPPTTMNDRLKKAREAKNGRKTNG